MPLSEFQRTVCRVIASNRIASGESYVAGGSALNDLIQAPRLSADIDLFHDADAALDASWTADRSLLRANGYEVVVLRERSTFVEAEVSRGESAVLMRWVRDSAFRFFPLMEHPDFGLTLHPFDLATNKFLALVGRVEIRDWIDIMASADRIQPLGYLAWAAPAKDPGFTPPALLDHAQRSTHYSAAELRSLDFAGEPPDIAHLSRRWKAMLAEAQEIIAGLPAEYAGRCVLNHAGRLFTGGREEMREAHRGGLLRFHEGRLRGTYPVVTGDASAGLPE